MTPTQRKKFLTYAVILLVISLVLIPGVCYVNFHYVMYLSNLELRPVRAVRQIETYVRIHEQWPSSWDDLEINAYEIEPYVDVRFDVTLDELVSDPELLDAVIVHKTNSWRFHSEDRFINAKRRLMVAINDAIYHPEPVQRKISN